MDLFPGLPPDVMRSFPQQRAVIRDAPPPPKRAQSSGCGAVVLLLVLNVLTIAGIVFYVIMNEGRVQKLEERVDDLKTATVVMVPSQRMRMDALLERSESAALPQTTRPPKPVIAEKPKWARNLAPKWLQFETPAEPGSFRLPPSGTHAGLYQAFQNGYTVECMFSGKSQPARASITFEFHKNDEDGQEYADVIVTAPAFRGRECAIEWMSE